MSQTDNRTNGENLPQYPFTSNLLVFFSAMIALLASVPAGLALGFTAARLRASLLMSILVISAFIALLSLSSSFLCCLHHRRKV
jgi:hypothetical protein